ncbi:MAG: tetratricopeptide repeat protein [Lewinellaceae bacterium]|nr:tetratricopeptide repeat protein [Lewinellaceae bacterium]
MKTLPALLILLAVFSLTAQTEKGAAPLTSPEGTSPGVTYAVVVGISDYQSPDIPDLQFADRDAEAFALYLQSSAGGSLPDANVRLLTNKKATTAAVAEALDWLVEQSGEGDQAIIYFSGHGDVEAKTARQPGFLLCYDSPSKIYIAGSYPLFYLQLIIETLSSDKNVQTLVITDACRAGKLAGSAIGGTQATAANLAKQYANEIKILSCQPDEFSLEGEQWGGGRGAFSYHLIEGLVGLADKNSNGNINLLEIENYLETVVPAETNPQSQIPMTVGSKSTKVADVDAGILAKLKDLKARQLPTMAAIESKGFAETLLANSDSAIQKKYEAFIAALEHKRLLDAQDGQPSADALYRELMQEESLAALHRLMTRQFATALQDDAQQAINAYLLTNPTELEKRWKGDTTYAQYPRYLHRAAELLGESHYMHDYLIAKQLYFEGLNLRLQVDQGNQLITYQEALEKQEAALALENRAAFFYNELGVLHTRMKQSEKAIANFEKAIELAPEWGLPYVNLCLEQFYNNDIEKAIATGDKAIAIMPDYPQLYNLLSWVNANEVEYLDKRNWKRSGVELKEDFIYDYDETKTPSENKVKFERSIQLLQKAIALDSMYASAHCNLGFIYDQIGEIEKAAYHLRKSVSIDSTKYISQYKLGVFLFKINQFKEGEVALKNAANLTQYYDPESAAWCYNALGILYRNWEKTDLALEAYQKAMDLLPRFAYNFYAGMAFTYFYNKKEYDKAEWYFLKSLEANPNDVGVYYWVGLYYQNVNRFQDAEWMLLKALEIHPEYSIVQNLLLQNYITTGQYEKVLTLQQQRLEKAPHNIINLANMEIVYFQMGDLEKAGEYSKKVEAVLKDEESQVRDLARQYLTGKYFEKSIYYYQKNIALNPDDINNEYNISCAYALWGKSEAAIDWLSKTIEKGYENFDWLHTDPDLESIRDLPAFKALMSDHFPGQKFEKKPAPSTKKAEPDYYFENCLQLAKYYEKVKENERANFLYQKTINLRPTPLTNIQALHLAEAYLRLGQEDQAKSACPDRIESEDAGEVLAAARLFYLLGKRTQADQYFEQYITMSPNSLLINFPGVFYRNHGENLRAEQLFKAAIERAPDQMRLRRGLARVYFFSGQKSAAYQALDEAINRAPNVAETHTLKCILAYYDEPMSSKKLFEQSDIYPVWECMERMRNNQYASADQAWESLQKQYAVWWMDFVKYKYLQMKIRQGKTAEALELFDAILRKGDFVNYQLLVTDTALDPIRDMDTFKALMRQYFPEKTTN